MSTICLPGPTGEGADRNANRPEGEDAALEGNGGQDGECEPSQRTREESRQGHGPSRDRRRSRRRRPDDHHIPDRNAILAFLVRLTQAQMAGFVSPQQGNAINATLRNLLDHLPNDRESAAPDGSLPATLVEHLRANPTLLEAMMPLLSDQQLAELADDEEPADGP